jgi:predicted Rossmann fold flavoprotein
MNENEFDVIVAGAGPAGIMAAITAAKNNRVLLIEKLPQIGAKLKATGGGKCNLTNTLPYEDFIAKFGKNGRFMQDAFGEFFNDDLLDFFSSIGVKTHAPDGFRVFPVSHQSVSIVNALKNELDRLKISTLLSTKVLDIMSQNNVVAGVKTDNGDFYSKKLILATGGLGYPSLGAQGDGYDMAQRLSHHVTPTSPAMLPLKLKEDFSTCTADTISNVKISIGLKKHKKLHANGDLIFTREGIRGPVVLDFAREITPLLAQYKEVPIIVNFIKELNQEKLYNLFKTNPQKQIIEVLGTLLPHNLCIVLCKIMDIEPYFLYSKLLGHKKEILLSTIVATPLNVIGHEGFEKAMITRGGVSLKEIDPKTMQSKLVEGLYFAGEVVDIDGPCGGYNLQWAFSSGFLAGS